MCIGFFFDFDFAVQLKPTNAEAEIKQRLLLVGDVAQRRRLFALDKAREFSETRGNRVAQAFFCQLEAMLSHGVYALTMNETVADAFAEALLKRLRTAGLAPSRPSAGITVPRPRYAEVSDDD